jgi:hypothetical protein
MNRSFKVNVAFQVNADSADSAKRYMNRVLADDDYEGFEVIGVEAPRTSLDDFMDAKAAFYAAGQCDGEHKKEAEAYIDAAIAALKYNLITTQQLGDVWQEVKPYL